MNEAMVRTKEGADHEGLLMRLRISIRGRVRPPARPSIPWCFRTTNMAVFVGKDLSNDIIINDSMRNDQVVASYVPPHYSFFLFSTLLFIPFEVADFILHPIRDLTRLRIHSS